VRLAIAVTLAAVVTLHGLTASASNALEPTHISLPSGPGSIEGLGRNFAPSLASGTASYGVEIVVPPSVGGFAPHLSLEYDSAGGVTELGMGWRLAGLPRVRRRTENGLPRFVDTDPMELAGMGIPCDLLEVAAGTFRPEFESGAFVRVQRAGGDTWQARDQSGTTWNFGGAGFEEVEGANVATYLPSEALDLHGHRIAYNWDTSDGYALLQSAVWNDFGADARNEVVLSYENRPDPHVLFNDGIRQALTRRLTAIEVRHGGALVRRYELAYGQDVHSRLASVTLVGRDGVSRLPTLSFGYTPQALQPKLVVMQGAPGRTPADPNVEISDLDGDGLPDLLVTLAGQYQSYVNQDGTSWQPSVDWDPSQSPSVALGAIGVQLADLDGDGAIDLVAKSGTTDFRYFPGSTARSFRRPVQIATVPNFTFEDPDTKLADMDGDRRIDAIITTADGIAIGYNLDGVDWTVPQLVGQVDARQALRFSDGGRTQLCDINGDRVEDFCYLTPGSLVYWLGRGRGAFEPAQTASGVPDFDPSSPWELHDLNGDGWVDLVHVAAAEVDFALAHSAGHFDPVQTLTSVPTKGPNTTVRFVDMNASGTTDIVWIDVSGDVPAAWQYLELFPAGRAGLLQRIDNGLGKVTTVSYGPAALDAAAARASGAPWTSRMNVAMPVVRRMQADDSLGDPVLETDYTYGNGTWSPIERTFAGFAGGTETDVGDAYTPTLVTTSTFDVGLEDRTLRGVVLTAQTSDTTGVVFKRETSTWTTRQLEVATDGRTVNYSFKASEQTDYIEGTDPSKSRTTLVEWDQDSYGNVTSEHNWGEVVAGNKLAGNDEAITLRTFANDEGDWILGRLATEELQDASGHRVRMKRNYYDGAAFQGLPLGQVARGDLTRQEEWVGPDLGAFELDVATAYDMDGNPIETRDARGGGRLFTWDPEARAFAASESIKLESRQLTESARHDAALGTLLQVTTYDGQSTSFAYDPFGRLAAVIEPGDTSEQPTRSYAYVEAAPLSRVITERRVWPGRSEVEHTEDLYDGLARKRGSLTADENGRWVLAGVALLDARGEERRTLRARFATVAEHDAPPLRADGPGSDTWHDAVGRTVRTRSQLGLETRMAFLPLIEQSWDGAQSDSTSPYEHTPTTKAHDGLGRLVARTEVLKGTTVSQGYSYDAAGRLLARTDPEGTRSRYAYDGRGRRVMVDDPDAGSHRFVYDPTGNLLEHHKPDGSVRRFTYDLAGRLITDDWDGDGVPEVNKQWDRSDRAPGDPLYLGKLAKMTDPAGSIENEYDERQRAVATHFTIGGATFDIRSAYDDQDREYWHQYPDQSSLRIYRNPRGQLSGYGNAVQFDYDGDGVELRRSFNTGVVALTGYDDDRRRTEQVVTAADGSTLQHLKWTYDGANDIASVTDLRPGVGADRDRSERYGYDNLYRLVSAGGSWGSAQWSYSSSGNLVARTSDVPALNAGGLTYGAGAGPHALTGLQGRTLVYDANGRLTGDGERTLDWDGADHLVAVTASGGASEQSVFDGEGTRRVRVQRDADGTEHTTYFLDATAEVRDGALVRYVVHSGQRIAELTASNGVPNASAAGKGSGGCTVGRSGGHRPLDLWPLFLFGALVGILKRRWCAAARLPCAALAVVLAGSMLACSASPQGPSAILDGTIDHLGVDDRLLFDDAIGSLSEQASGDGHPLASFAAYPFGLARYDSSEETQKYARSSRDSSVGLDSMGARFYAPNLGVWTSVDPVAVGDPTRYVDQPAAATNPYSYAGLTPTVAADRNGHFWHIVIGAAIGAVVSGGLEAYKQYAETGHIEDWGKVAEHAAVGALGGAILAAAPAAGLPAVMALGGVESGVEGMAHRLIDSGGKSVGTLEEIATDVSVGALSAGTGHVLTELATPAATHAAATLAKEAPRCFAAGTLVAASEGLRPIETIGVGDTVWSRDEETGETALRSVARVFVTPDAKLVEIAVQALTGAEETLSATREHPFWVKARGWVAAHALQPGDELASLSGRLLTVAHVRAVPDRETVYNLEVAEFHTYFVGEVGAWVHNACTGTARAPRNAHLAGKTHPVTGVPFDKAGYPDFKAAGVVRAEVKITPTGSRAGDFRAANREAGFSETPDDFTWHHHQDGTTMQLVPEDVHAKTGHTGGFSITRTSNGED